VVPDGSGIVPMGNEEQPCTSSLDPGLMHLFGFRELLSLDDRFRFRIPDHLAERLHREMGRVAGNSQMPPAAFERLSFYFVPGPGQRLLLFPSTNIRVALQRFERPSLSSDPARVRAARDYFYSMMRFVEADRQNRFAIPDHLREHAGIDGSEKEVLLNTHDLWLVLARGSLAAEQDRRGREAFDEIGADILDPVEGPRNPRADAIGQ